GENGRGESGRKQHISHRMDDIKRRIEPVGLQNQLLIPNEGKQRSGYDLDPHIAGTDLVFSAATASLLKHPAENRNEFARGKSLFARRAKRVLRLVNGKSAW